ncbi:MAG: hypothetical protein ACRDRO_16505 [Pseudonocardiaceae bacterium]
MSGQPSDSGELRVGMVQRLRANSYLASGRRRWHHGGRRWWTYHGRNIPDLVWIENDGDGPTLLPYTGTTARTGGWSWPTLTMR